MQEMGSVCLSEARCERSKSDCTKSLAAQARHWFPAKRLRHALGMLAGSPLVVVELSLNGENERNGGA